MFREIALKYLFKSQKIFIKKLNYKIVIKSVLGNF